MLVSEEALSMCVRFMLSTLAGLQRRPHFSKRTHKNFWYCPAL
ncbi:hypothetical protein BDL97_02G168900 [Sphagnum fallax]|nr:hypothetical protein BDL97_02G168900 [Sphagnum fallax]